VDWFVTTLTKTPGHAPADTIATAAIINQLETPGGVDQVAQQLLEARKKDPQAQLFPEITASIVGQDYMRDGDLKSAIAGFEIGRTSLSELRRRKRQPRRSVFKEWTERTRPAAWRESISSARFSHHASIVLDRHRRVPC
jgi:hypothetical protein